jgi:hypothetical protein
MFKPFKEIYYPELVKDVQEIYWEHIDPLASPRPDPNRPLRRLFTEKKPEFEKLHAMRAKYPFLGPHMLLFKVPVKWSTEIHLDGTDEITTRLTSFNIPIKGCTTNCVTEFYDAEDEDFWKDPLSHTRWLLPRKTPNKIYEYSLTTNPVLTNPQVPHRVNNLTGTEIRVSVSWTIDPKFSWEHMCKYFDDQGRSL